MAQGFAALDIDAVGRVVEGVTCDTILREAARMNSDLIVIGSHGHGVLYEAVIGSVAAGVIRHAVCPVMVVPAPKRG